MAVPKIQSLVVQLRSHKPCQKKKKGTSGHKAVSSLEPAPCLHTWGNQDPREGGRSPRFLFLPAIFSLAPWRLREAWGSRPAVPPTPHPHAPWLSSGSQKHFFSSGKQLQIPKPALIPRRSPGSCPPMMLPPPEDRHHPLSSPLSASGGAGQPGPPDRVMRGPCPPDVSTLTPREHSKIRSLGHPRQEPQHACVCAKSLQSG